MSLQPTLSFGGQGVPNEKNLNFFKDSQSSGEDCR